MGFLPSYHEVVEATDSSTEPGTRSRLWKTDDTSTLVSREYVPQCDMPSVLWRSNDQWGRVEEELTRV